MWVKITVISADVPSLLKTAAKEDIILNNVTALDPLTVSFEITNKYYISLARLMQKRGDEWHVNKRIGMGVKRCSFKNRWILGVSVILLLMLSIWLPHRVLFITISGNVNVSSESILLAAEECGLFFGVARDEIRSVSVKNYLLERLPQLAWACVNTKGCVADIYVSEKTIQHSSETLNSEVVGIRAVTDGIIISAQVKSGFPDFSVGQAVKEGQLLVTGIQKDGLLWRGVRSEAEIYALTTHRITAILDQENRIKSFNGKSEQIFSIIFGKKRIKLLKDSRIYPTGCDKILKEYFLSLPGGYVLPFGVAVETTEYYDLVDLSEGEKDTFSAISAMERYLLDQMISGRILDKHCIFEQKGTAIVEFQCVEMIGREFSEEIDISYGKNN